MQLPASGIALAGYFVRSRPVTQFRTLLRALVGPEPSSDARWTHEAGGDEIDGEFARFGSDSARPDRADSQIVTFHGGLAVTAIQLTTLFLYQFSSKSAWCYFPMLFVSAPSWLRIWSISCALISASQNLHDHSRPVAFAPSVEDSRTIAFARLFPANHPGQRFCIAVLGFLPVTTNSSFAQPIDGWPRLGFLSEWP